MIKVKGHSDLRRNPDSNSIINVDIDSYEKYRRLTKKNIDYEKRIGAIEDKLDNLTNMMSDLLNKIK
jgi:hypothetical protein